MNYVLEAAGILLLLWAAGYLVRHVRQQWKGRCDGDCGNCGKSCRH